ncbi:MAG TPA: Gfo/Idh/MocA family oxidoreductase [Candidatus Paceibacterota bacterium]|nr:Gfo/Idh/MocA family oxidoreductase [Candidatus Paceibacterota bacterium]HRZ58782.1 Gfo/Idh/MocA family oxidoreductase [Candidatus Paceibacterota bacterium]
MNQLPPANRRRFLRNTALLGGALAAVPNPFSAAASELPIGKITVGVIGCGSVSRMYLPNLAACPHVELVSACDIIPERAKRAAEKFRIPNHYPGIAPMLTGAPFDLLVNLTDMQEHEHLNRQAIEAGKHVWSEKPIANSLAAGQELLALAQGKGLRLWGAPTVVQSPQFAFMAKTLADGTLGRVASAHASYGHLGPDWAAFFYTKGGGSLPDLGVYNLTFLTGLLGPGRSVAAMTGIVTPKRNVQGKGEVTVTEEDNAMVLLDHGNGLLSHIECGFNYFNPEDHAYTGQDHHTLSVTGRNGLMKLAGYDWGPHAVDLSTAQEPKFKRYADAKHAYVWENGASLCAECLATGKEPLFTPEHALHVVEIITAARESQVAGKHVKLSSTFKWPVVT